jgi:hypothetical protein
VRFLDKKKVPITVTDRLEADLAAVEERLAELQTEAGGRAPRHVGGPRRRRRGVHARGCARRRCRSR